MMRGRFSTRALLSLAAASLLAGCGMGESGTTYPMTAKDVRKILLDTEPPLFIFGGNAVSGPALPIGNSTIRWTLQDPGNGRGLLSLVAQIEEAGAGQARVSVSVEPADGDRKDQVAQRMADNPTVVALYRAAMEEQIDAALEKRDFDFTVLQDELASATLANIPRISASMEEAGRAARERDRKNIERAYREEAQGWHDEGSYSRTEPAFGEPMDTGTGAGGY